MRIGTKGNLMSLSKKYFTNFIKDHIFVDIYTDCYGESFFGNIVKSSDEYILIETYDNEGRYDGIVILEIENVNRVQWGGNECLEVEKLIDRSAAKRDYEIINIESIESALRTTQAKFGYVEFEIQDQDVDICFIGSIEELDDEVVKLHCFGTRQSLKASYGLYSISDITKVSAGEIYAENIYKLHMNKF